MTARWLIFAKSAAADPHPRNPATVDRAETDCYTAVRGRDPAKLGPNHLGNSGSMLRGIYDWTMRLSASPNAVWLLSVIAFAESSVFPVPVDLLLIPMILAARERAWRLAAICTIASVLGGFFGYLIGFALFDTIGDQSSRFTDLTKPSSASPIATMSSGRGSLRSSGSRRSPTRSSRSPAA